MTGKERALACITGTETDRPSVISPTSIATAESCRMIGVNFNDVHLDSDKMAALAAVGYEKLGFDSVMPYFSVVQEAAALGCTINWGSTEDMPTQKNPPFAEPEQFTMPDDFLNRLPIRAVLEAIRILKNKAGKEALIIGKSHGAMDAVVSSPWS